MDVFLSITAFLCCLVGIVGCIVPVLPGPVLSYAGLFCAYACSYSTLTPAEMWLWAGLTAAVTAADYFLPGYMAKLFGGTRAGMVGATVGMIAGLFVGGLNGSGRRWWWAWDRSCRFWSVRESSWWLRSGC